MAKERKFSHIDQLLVFLKWAKEDYEGQRDKRKNELGMSKSLILRYHFFCYSQIIYAILDSLLKRKYFVKSSEEYTEIEKTKKKIASIIPNKLKHFGLDFNTEGGIIIQVNKEKDDMDVFFNDKEGFNKTDSKISKIEAKDCEEYVKKSWDRVKELIKFLENKGYQIRFYSNKIFN